MDFNEGTRRESPHGGHAALFTAAALGMAFLAIVGAVGIGTAKALAQEPPDLVPVWVYPSGAVFPHPELPNTVCISAVGHPERPIEVHCAPIPADLGTPV